MREARRPLRGDRQRDQRDPQGDARVLGRDDPSADDALFRKCWRLRDVRGYLATRNEAVVSGWDRGDHPARSRAGSPDHAQGVAIPTDRAALRLTGNATKSTKTMQ